MFQLFNKDTIESRYIKSILNNTYLPSYSTVRDGDYIIEGNQYVYKNSIIECTSSGLADGNTTGAICGLPLSIADDSFICGVGQVGKFEKISDFTFNKFLPGITYTYNSTSSTYDSITHKYLGKYLRCLRDIRNIDLMPYYNCYSGLTTDLISLSLTDVNSKNSNGSDKTSYTVTVDETSSSKYTVHLIPVCFNKYYSIFIDSDNPIYLKSVLLHDNGRVMLKNKPLDDSLILSANVISSSSFLKPFTFNTNCLDPVAAQFENNLYIAMQVSKSVSSSIVVLEGDYRNYSTDKVCSSELFIADKAVTENGLTYLDYNDYYLFNYDIKPSLVSINDKTSYAFSNRLVEYLLGSVITEDETIKNNILRIQDKIGLRKKYNISDDIWSPILRYVLYNNYKNDSTKFTKYNRDISGNIDKDMENFIYKYRG